MLNQQVVFGTSKNWYISLSRINEYAPKQMNMVVDYKRYFNMNITGYSLRSKVACRSQWIKK